MVVLLQLVLIYRHNKDWFTSRKGSGGSLALCGLLDLFGTDSARAQSLSTGQHIQVERRAQWVGLARTSRLTVTTKVERYNSTRNPADVSARACFSQLSLLKRPPWASTMA